MCGDINIMVFKPGVILIDKTYLPPQMGLFIFRRDLFMAESNTTKQALASALKELSIKSPLDKISVTDICRQCGVNRKSFYYHFQDKFDLVNWIFDSEFVALAGRVDNDDGRRTLMSLLEYLYENRTFYRRAMRIKGQNSFSEHFRELMLTTAKAKLRGIRGRINNEQFEFSISFYADAFLCTIERWLTGRDCIPPVKLFRLISSCIDDHPELSEAISEA